MSDDNFFKPFNARKLQPVNEEVFRAPSNLYTEYIRVRQRAIRILLSEGHDFTDLTLVPDKDNNCEYVWNFKLKNGWKFTQKYTDLWKEDRAEVTYIAERAEELPERLKKD